MKSCEAGTQSNGVTENTEKELAKTLIYFCVFCAFCGPCIIFGLSHSYLVIRT
jgi:hypothetical protein